MTNIMLDLETLGNSSNSVIVAIGAVKFDPATGETWDDFYEVIDPKSCTDAGLVMDAATVIWWMKQSHEARNVFFGERAEMLSLFDALTKFYNWVDDREKALVWGNGANFDNVILENAYKAVGQEKPWPYWGDRCYRTMKALRRDIKLTRVGTHHNALDDAKTQALHLMEIMRSI